jgi:hypothetical protein
MAKEITATTPNVETTKRVITTPPAPQTVRVYAMDGTYQDVFPVDAKEIVASGEYTLEPSSEFSSGENVHKPIRPETVTGLMPEMGIPLAELDAKAASEDDDSDATTTLRGPLPDDFPSRAALDTAGLGTYAKLRKQIGKGEGWWKDVGGIGEKNHAAIEDALKEK